MTIAHSTARKAFFPSSSSKSARSSLDPGLNGKRQELVVLGVTVQGEGTVTTRNGKGQELVRLGTYEDGEGVVAVFDPNGRYRRGVLTVE